MRPKQIEDFIPLMSVDADELREYKTNLERDNSIGSDHPIYYFSERLNVSFVLHDGYSFNCHSLSNSIFSC